MHSVPRRHVTSFLLQKRRPKPNQSLGRNSCRPGGNYSPGYHRNEIVSSLVDETIRDTCVRGLKTRCVDTNAMADYIDEMARKWAATKSISED